MKSISAVFCECCRKLFVDTPSTNTKNDMCIDCNRTHNVPEEKWVVTRDDYFRKVGREDLIKPVEQLGQEGDTDVKFVGDWKTISKEDIKKEEV